MSLVSYLADITERRTENLASVVFEDYTYHAKGDCGLSPKGQELVELAEEWGTTREKLIAMRQWAQRITKECTERLAQEKTLIYTLNEPRDRVLAARYVSTGEAAEIGCAVPGDLLSLDDYFGGLLVQGRYVFVSDSTFEEGLKKYRPEDLLNGLIAERSAA
jgi:hypothetical protein